MGNRHSNLNQGTYTSNSNSNENKVTKFNELFENLELDKNNYVVLGQGSSGVVYKDLSNNDKLIKIAKGSKQLLINELENALLADKMDIGPRIYKTKSFVKNIHGRHYLVLSMQKLDYSLHDVVKDNLLSPDKLKEAISQINALMDKMHTTMKICHKDLHNQNIMYNVNEKRWYIIDFGYADKYTNSCRNVHYDQSGKRVKQVKV